MDIKNFVKENSINVNDTHEWIDLIEKFIVEYGLQSRLFEDKRGIGIYLSSQEEHQLLEDLLYEVEETKTTLNYIFESNIQYGDNYED